MPTPSDENIAPELTEENSPQASEPSGKRAIWQEFCADDALLQMHNVNPHELEALSRVAMLGSVDSKADLVFMLSAIRRRRR